MHTYIIIRMCAVRYVCMYTYMCIVMCVHMQMHAICVSTRSVWEDLEYTETYHLRNRIDENRQVPARRGTGRRATWRSLLCSALLCSAAIVFHL